MSEQKPATTMEELEHTFEEAVNQLDTRLQAEQRLPTSDYPFLDPVKWAMETKTDLLSNVRHTISEYQQEAALCTNEPQFAARILDDAARLYENIIGDTRSAFETAKQALALDPASEAVRRTVFRLLPFSPNPAQSEKLFQQALEAATATLEQTAINRQLASFLEFELPDEAKAAETHLKILEEDPTDKAALESLLRLNLRCKNWPRLAMICRESAAQEKDLTMRTSLLLFAALVASEELSNEQVQLAILAMRTAPRSSLALPIAIGLLKQQSRWSEAIELLQEQLSSTPESAALVHFQISYIYAEKLKQHSAAIDHARLAYQAKTDEPLLVNWLIDLYRRDNQWAPLIEVLHRRFELGSEEEERVEILMDIAEILEARLGRIPEAIQAIEEALLISPLDILALQSLGRLYQLTGRWEDLVKMHLTEAYICKIPSRRAQALYRAARISLEKLDKRSQAIEQLEEAVKADLSLSSAVRLLEELYRQEKRYADLILLYREEVKKTNDAEIQATLLENIAVIYEYQLSDMEQATAAYQELLDLRPANINALKALARLYETQKLWPALLSVMRAQVSHMESAQQKATLLVRMGQILEESLGDRDMALAHYQEAMVTAPLFADAYEHAGRLLFTASRWPEVIEIYYRALNIVSDPTDRLRILLRIGRMQEHFFNDWEAAANTYQRALEIDNFYWPAMRALIRVSHLRRDYSKLVDLETRLLEAMPPGKSRAAALLRAGIMLADSNQDSSSVRDLLLRATEENEASSLAGPLRQYYLAEHKYFNELPQMLEPFWAAIVRASALSQYSQAASILAEEKINEKTTEGLAALRWRQILCAAAGDVAGETASLKLRIEHETDSVQRNNSRLRLAELAEHGRLTDEDLPQICADLLQEMSGDAHAMEVLEHLIRRSKNEKMLIDLLQEQSNAFPTPQSRALARSTLAMIHLRAGRKDEAIFCWRAALEEDPLCRWAYDGLKIHYAEHHDEAGLAWVLERGLEAVRHPDLLIPDLLRRADLRLAAGERAQAQADLERILKIRPTQPNSLERLLKLLREDKNFEAIAKYLQKAAVETATPARQGALYFDLALLYRDELKNLELANKALTKTISVDPDNIPALLAAAQIKEQIDQPTESLALLNRVALRTENQQELITALLSISRLSFEMLGDPIRARISLDEILEHDADNLLALRQMLSLATKLGDTEKSEFCLRKLSILEKEAPARAECLASLSRLLRKNQTDVSEEILAPLEEAISLAPGNALWVKELVDIYLQQKRFIDAEQLLKTQNPAIATKERQFFLLLHARLLSQELGQHEQARRLLLEVLRADPENKDVTDLFLAELSDQALQDEEWRNEALKLHRRMLKTSPVLVDSLRAVIKLADQSQLPDESFAAQSALVFIGKATEEEQYFSRQRRNLLPQNTQAALQLKQVEKIIGLPQGNHPVRAVLQILRQSLRELMATDWSQYGLNNQEVEPVAADHQAHETVKYCAQLLGVDNFHVVEAKGGVARGACEPSATPLIILPPDFSRFSVGEQRFLCGRLLTRIAMGTEALDGGRTEPLTPRALEILLTALIRCEEPTFGQAVAAAGILDDQTKKLRRILSETELADCISQARLAQTPLEQERLLPWIKSTEIGALRGGLLCAGHLGVVTSFYQHLGVEALSEDLAHDLVGFSISSEYLELRQQLQLALTNQVKDS